MSTAVHSVVVELRMLARPLEIRASPQPMATQGITALVTAMIANPTSLPRQPAPNSGRRIASTITARATKPEVERNRSSTVGLMSWTTILIARKDPPQIRPSRMKDSWGSSRPLDLDTCWPVVGGEDERHRPVVFDRDPHDRSKAARLGLDPSVPELLDELVVELLRVSGITRLQKARPAAPAHVGEQGELGDDQGGTADVDQAQVHLPGLVREDAQVDDLVGQPAHGAAFVVTCGTHQQHETASDGCRVAIPADRSGAHTLRNHSHGGSCFGVNPPLPWRPGSARPQLWPNAADTVGGRLSINPNLIPEGEQRLRRSRTRDEREPSGFPLISQSHTNVALAAGFTPAATLSSSSASRRMWNSLQKAPTLYRRVSSACGVAARAMSGNHPG